MSANRPFVLSIAGFDPSGGAGVLADVKTFEQHQVYGLAIITANTIQTETDFIAIEWMHLETVIKSIKTLFGKYTIKAVKIGIVPSFIYLKAILDTIKRLSPTTKIVWDTVLKSTTEFDFMEVRAQSEVIAILTKVDLITPNFNEILQLSFNENNVETEAVFLSNYCDVLVKGGHNPDEIGVDYLYQKGDFIKLLPKNKNCYEKHGSGCVLSASIAANMALDQDIKEACSNAKIYIENYLSSNTTKLGYHNV